ncbi:hybrid sensor histidine kinase/response regulator [Filimonas zeae]|uniref:histidine kinase n=2 Tax=Filimonas zeae TaxID=1737353 RepID=A0A917J0C9_9BACT|nr:hybrid sensor histidine kinase/response regulator [Filimonas zeae]
MIAFRLFLLFLLVVGNAESFARQDSLHFINFSSKDGLPSDNINVILKDRWGYMWFGTDDGLARYDGSHFTIYSHNPADTTSIRSNSILELYEDAKGTLWIGTHKGLSQYNRSKDAFINSPVTRGASVRTICADHAGNLWLGGYSGLFRYTPATQHSRYYRFEDSAQTHLTAGMFLSLYEDSRQRLWVGSNEGLYQYELATDAFRLHTGGASPAAARQLAIKSISEDRKGNIWFGTIDGGINVLPAGSNTFYNYSTNAPAGKALCSNRIYKVTHDADGRVWVGTEKGLDILYPATGMVEHVTGNARNQYSLQGSSVRTIYIDAKGIYWVGAFQSGVNKYDRNLTAFHLVRSNPFDPYGLSAPKVTSFAPGADGTVYIGTDAGGLNLFNIRTGLFTRIPIGRQPLTVLALERVQHELWIGTYMQGIYVLNTLSGAVRHYSADDGVSGLVSDEVFCLHKDRQGNVWIGTNGKGVQVYVPGKRVFVAMKDYISGATGDKAADKSFIRDIQEDAEGRIWIAAPGRGVDMYDPVARTFRMYGRWQTKDLPVDEVQTLLPGKAGVIWAGTGGRGLLRLDYKKDSFAVYTAREGLANNVIARILADSAGTLWLSTNKGISAFDPVTLTCKNFTADNGLQQSAFARGSGLVTSDGNFFFGGLNGFNYFAPASLHYNHHIPAVVFTGLKVDNNEVVPGEHSAISTNIAIAQEIRLKYKQNFSVGFTVLDFTSPNECRYQYQLQGFDKSWNAIGSGKTAVFTNLDPGEYTLLVKAYSPNSNWVTQPASIKIFIKPPLWRTGYAWAAYLLLAACILWGIRYRGIQRLHRKYAAEQERRRVRQLIEEERKEAERQRAFDEVKIKFLTNLSHEFRTPLSLIAGPVQALLEDEADPARKSQLSMVRRNTRRLLNLVNQLLDFRNPEAQELRLHQEPGDIVSFLQEAAESFRDLADRRHIRFHFHTDLQTWYTQFDKDKMERVLFNLLGNAFKFTGENGVVTLHLQPQPDNAGITFTVTDNGIGMTEEEQRHIFDRFYQGETRPDIMNQGSGIGLSITRDFVQLHGGTVAVHSAHGKGSTFTVKLPLQQQQPVTPAQSTPAAPQQQEEPASTGLQHSGTPAPSQQPVLPNALMQQAPTPTTETVQPAEQVAPAADTAQLPELNIPEGERLTVLLVEDSEDYRSFLKSQLSRYYKVVEAADGREGWQKALQCHPQVIVSDINMPHIDGITLSKKIRGDKRTAHIPIILLTALTGDANQLQGLQTGASDYLTKPFSPGILVVKIRNLATLNQRLKDTYTKRVEVGTQPAQVESENEKLLVKVTRYIEEHIEDENLSVEQLAKHLFMSRATLYNKLMELTGETPVEYIRSVRLGKAAALLETSDMRVAEIGYAVGFVTPNYFARAFKAKYQMSPTEYIAQKRKPAN